MPSFSTTGPDKKPTLDALKKAKNGEIVVLTVHGVPDYAHPRVTTPPELFEAYLNYLRDYRYTVIAMRDLAQFVGVGKKLVKCSPTRHSSEITIDQSNVRIPWFDLTIFAKDDL